MRRTLKPQPWLCHKRDPVYLLLAFYLNLPDDYRAFRICLCFSISSDYNARSFSFYQQIFSALAAVAAAAGIVLLSQHICVFYIMP